MLLPSNAGGGIEVIASETFPVLTTTDYWRYKFSKYGTPQTIQNLPAKIRSYKLLVLTARTLDSDYWVERCSGIKIPEEFITGRYMNIFAPYYAIKTQGSSTKETSVYMYQASVFGDILKFNEYVNSDASLTSVPSCLLTLYGVK